MRKYLKDLKVKIKDKAGGAARTVLDKYIDLGIAFEDILDEGMEPIEDIQNILDSSDELDLQPICDFIGDYIGMIVIGVKGFAEDTVLKNAERLNCKIISDCTLEGEAIVLQLSDSSGGRVSGHLKLTPSRHGSFAEREKTDIPLYGSRYRIFFYGGETLEYLDSERIGSIEYVESSL